MNLRNIAYLCHILFGIFPPFWLSNLIFGGIPKDTKSQLIRNILCMNYLANFTLFAEYLLNSPNYMKHYGNTHFSNDRFGFIFLNTPVHNQTYRDQVSCHCDSICSD